MITAICPASTLFGNQYAGMPRLVKITRISSTVHEEGVSLSAWKHTRTGLGVPFP